VHGSEEQVETLSSPSATQTGASDVGISFDPPTENEVDSVPVPDTSDVGISFDPPTENEVDSVPVPIVLPSRIAFPTFLSSRYRRPNILSRRSDLRAKLSQSIAATCKVGSRIPWPKNPARPIRRGVAHPSMSIEMKSPSQQCNTEASSLEDYLTDDDADLLHPPRNLVNKPATGQTSSQLRVLQDALHHNVIVAHQNDPSAPSVSISVRKRLDYGLGELSRGTGEISSLKLKEFIAMLLQARRVGRCADDSRWKIVAIHPETSLRYRLIWIDRPIPGIEMRGLKLDADGNKKHCIYGCVRNGSHQWLSGTKYHSSEVY
jgi:hypothetical protein